MMQTVAAIYVQPGGAYYGIDGVEPWGLPDKDAMRYAGPWPVVAHPPCARWGNYWFGSPSSPKRYKAGDDGGLFANAFLKTRMFLGVIEHPANSKAWDRFEINRPPSSGGWIRANSNDIGWTCHVEQGNYGHRSRKPTWLYCYGPVKYRSLPDLIWGKSENKAPVEKLSKKERAATPVEFRDVLLSIARMAGNHK